MSTDAVSTSSPGKLGSWGCIGHLTESQNADLIQFLEKANPDDIDVAKFRVESKESASLRFLRARDFSVSKALTLLSDCVKRKLAEKVDEYVSLTANEVACCDVEAMKKWYPHTQLGFDKLNRPVLFEHSGGVNSTALLHMTTLDHLIKYHWWTMENELNRMFEVAASQGSVTISTCVILDLAGMNLSHFSPHAMEHLKAIVAIDNTCYPELLGKMLVINAPWIAISMWDVLKGWLDPRTQAKIEIMRAGADSSNKLLEFISANQLPRAYGGSGDTAYCSCRDADSTDFVHIPRGGHLSRSVLVGAGQSLLVDSYLGEGEVGLEVWATSKAPATHSKGDVDKDGHPGELLRKELIKHADSHPHRLLLQLDNSSPAQRTFTVTWTNPARFYSRALTYVLTVVDPLDGLAAKVGKLEVVEKKDAAAATEQQTQKAESTSTLAAESPVSDGGKAQVEQPENN